MTKRCKARTKRDNLGRSGHKCCRPDGHKGLHRCGIEFGTIAPGEPRVCGKQWGRKK